MDAAAVDGGVRVRTERAVDAEDQQDNSADDDALGVLAVRAGFPAEAGREAGIAPRQLCGIEDLEHLPKARRRLTPSRPIAPEAIGAAVAGLASVQPLNGQTRAVHAAAWCGCDGAIRVAREDVGRHNALDKLIGALLREKAEPDEGFVLISSRCSFEMVAKTAAFGAATLVSVSAPTSLALRRADECGLALIAIARSDQALGFPGADPDVRQGAAA